MCDTRVLVVVMVTLVVLLHDCSGRPEYEDCNRKVRRRIMESCGNPKGKRSVRYSEETNSSQEESSLNSPMQGILGKILGVPSDWTEDAPTNNANRQYKRSTETMRQLMLECCLDDCPIDRFLGLC